MAISNFTASVWAKEVLMALRKSLVYANVVNTDYEGDITGKGSKVKINSISDVTIGTYTKGSAISREQLSDAQQELEITEQDYFAFEVEDIDAAQTQSNLMAAAMESAGYGLKNGYDQFIAALYSQASATNLIGTDGVPIIPTAATFYEYVVDMNVLLDEADVPEDGRWGIIPSWCHGLLLKDDRFTLFKDQAVTQGKIAQVDNMVLYKSNNVPNTAGTLYKLMFGHKQAISAANQINKVEAFRPEDGFQDAVKGLHTYGAKVVRPSSLAVLTCSKS